MNRDGNFIKEWAGLVSAILAGFLRISSYFLKFLWGFCALWRDFFVL